MVSIEQLILSYYIKNKQLMNLTKAEFENTIYANCNEINIYIDMANIAKSFYNPGVTIGDYASVTSGIINLCAHMRSFFRNYCEVNTKIFIIYSDMTKNYLHSTFYPGYYQKYLSMISSKGQITDMVNQNLEYLELLCPYLHGIYFIRTNEEFSVKALDIMYREEANRGSIPNIVLTKDLYAYQLPSIMPGTVIFRPKKSNGIDESWLIDYGNVLQAFIANSRNIKEDNSANKALTKSYNLRPEILSLLMTITNLNCRNISSILNINTAINKLLVAVSDNSIINGYNADIMEVYYALLNKEAKFPISAQGLISRFKAIDLKFNHTCYMDNPESKLNYIIDLENPEEVKAINNKWFRNCPLDLERL